LAGGTLIHRHYFPNGPHRRYGAKLQQRIALAKRIAALANHFFSVQDRA